MKTKFRRGGAGSAGGPPLRESGRRAHKRGHPPRDGGRCGRGCGMTAAASNSRRALLAIYCCRGAATGSGLECTDAVHAEEGCAVTALTIARVQCPRAENWPYRRPTKVATSGATHSPSSRGRSRAGRGEWISTGPIRGPNRGYFWQPAGDRARGGSFSGSLVPSGCAARGVVHWTGTWTWIAPPSRNGISSLALAAHAAEADG